MKSFRMLNEVKKKSRNVLEVILTLIILLLVVVYIICNDILFF